MGSSKKQTVGYKYYLGEHLIFTHGPVDNLTRLTFDGNRVAWRGYLTAEGSFSVFAPTLFGGEDIGREGGVKGTIDFCPGEPTQTQNAYLQARLGTPLPAFRGVSGLVFNQVYLGTSAYLKKVSARFQRIFKTTNGATQWYPEKAAIPSPVIDGFVQTVDINANSDGAIDGAAAVSGNKGTLISGVSAEDLVVVLINTGQLGPSYPPAFVAASVWGLPNLVPGEPQSGSQWRFSVVENETGSSTAFVASGGPYDGYALARAAAVSEFPNGFTMTGATSYRFFFEDTPISDNTGGTSLIVMVNPLLDMNPAHIIRECLTDTLWGMGYNVADVDDVAFAAAADQLFSEGMGISLLWDQQMPIEQFIGEIIKHIDASLYVDRSTGKFVLKLIRGDYDLMSLPLFDESNIDKVEGFQRPSFGELTNSVTVNYFDNYNGVKASVTIEDPALILMQGATINTTLQYPGFTNASLVGRVALRDLKTLSNPLASCTIYADSDAEPLNVGDVFRWSWAEYGIVNMAMRVTAIAYGDGLANKVKMQVAQDVFTLPEVGIVTPPGTSWEDPNQPPVASEYQIAIELPYVELLQQLGLSTVETTLASTPEVGYAGIAVSRPGEGSINARMMIDSGAGYEEVGLIDFCPIAILDEPLTQTQTTFAIREGLDLDLALDLGVVGSWCQINDELMIVVALDPDAETMEVERGTLDTTPALHAEGDAIFFWDNFAQNDDEQYVETDALNIKALTITGQGQLDIADAPAQALTIEARAIKPYPPGNLTVDGTTYPASVDFAFDITWSHRDRLSQGDVLIGTTETDIGPEAGTTYTVRLYLDAVLEDEVTGITDTFLNGVSMGGNGTARVEVWSVRDGIESYQPLWAEFAYTGAVSLTDDIPDWSLGNWFDHTPPTVGGIAPFTYAITSGALPTGLTLDTATGRIYGMPTSAGAYAFDLEVEDGNTTTDTISVAMDIAADADISIVQFLCGFGGTGGGFSNGNAVLDTAQSKFGPSSLLLDGTGDYVNYNGDTNQNFDANDFTIELWARFNSAASTQALISKTGGSPNRGWGFRWRQDLTALQFYFVTNGSDSFTELNSGSWTPSTGVWYHLAVVRSGTSLLFFVDGVQIGSAASIGSVVVRNAAIGIHVGEASSNFFNGWIDSVRITRTVARYTTGFTAPTLPFPPSVAAGDPNHGNVSRLWHYYGNDNAASSIEEGPDARAITYNGGAELDPTTVGRRWSTILSSLRCLTSADYASIASAADLQVNTGDFAIDGWFKLRSTKDPQTIVNKRDAAGAEEYSIAVNGSTGTISFSMFNSSAVLSLASSAGAVVINTWYYFRAVRVGSNCYLFLGVEGGTAALVDSGAQSGAPASNTGVVQFGRDGFNSSRNLDGYLQDIRFTKGAMTNRLPGTPASGFPVPPYPAPRA